jgi:hypothetical protein
MGTKMWMGAVALASVSCANGEPSGVDAVVADEGGRRLETVSVLVNLVVAEGSTGAWSDVAGRFLHPRHLAAPVLRVNGRPWAPFENADGERAPPPEATFLDGYALLEAPAPALLVAELGRAPVADLEGLETVGDWVALLSRYLGVGSYVADFEGVGLEGGRALPASFGPSPRLPLEVLEGEVARHLGEVTIPVRVEADL